jgi:hypothetical protein
MNHTSRTLLTLVAGLAAFGASGASLAGNVGYIGNCYGENLALPIAASGNTPVAVTTLSAESLSGLTALVVSPCGGFGGGNAALTTAAANGLVVIVHDNTRSAGALNLPGMSADVGVSDEATNADIDFPVGSPVITGPGGTLTNTSLDGGNSSNHGMVPRASLPAGSQVLATTADTSAVITFSYPYGSGRVVYSTIPLGCYLIGGNCAEEAPLLVVSRGMQAYAANVIAWAAPGFTSCAAEGFSGTKLTLCRQVCEMHYTGTKLNALIRTWTSLYHEDPPCAR